MRSLPLFRSSFGGFFLGLSQILIFSIVGGGGLRVEATSAPRLTQEFGNYFRAVGGVNLLGGKQNCMNPKTVWWNLRFGNECNMYSEMYLTRHFITEPNTKSFFKVATTLIFDRGGYEGFDEGSIKFGDAYGEAGYLDNLEFSFWAGQRRVRWGNVYAFDAYPLSMEGLGGGVGDISGPGGGRWSIFFLSKYAKVTTDTQTTTVGDPALSSLQLMLDEVSLGSTSSKLNFWIAVATTSSFSERTWDSSGVESSGSVYKAAPGFMLAGRSSGPAMGDGNYEVGLLYGRGVLSQFQMGNPLVRDCGSNGSAASTDANCLSSQGAGQSSRWRTFASLNRNPSPSWSYQVAFAMDLIDKGLSENTKATWGSLAFIPVYYLSKHYQLSGGLGYTYADEESDPSSGRARTQWRLAVGPQVALDQTYWARPLIRVFYSMTGWNDANRISFARTPHSNDTISHSIGFQTEVWF